MEARRRVEALIDTERSQLLKTLRFYVLRAGLASSRDGDTMAQEILNETVFEALRSTHRLTADMNPHPWLLGIALNLIKRKQVEIAKRERREPLVRDLLPDSQLALSDDDLFDQLPQLVDAALDEVEVKDEIADMLTCISESDSHVLKLAVAHDMNGEAIAQALQISPGAARVRLHRALNRLRRALLQRKEMRDV
jgi:RNA polymerase sigma factor (sigma-70 family)